MKIIKLIPILSVGFTLIFVSAKGDTGHASVRNKKNMTLLEGWENLESVFRNISKQGVKMLLPFLTENIGRTNLSKGCIRDTMHLISGVRDLKPWAIQFLDSTAKLWSGLISGTVTTVGSYEECLDIKVNSTRLSDKGKRLFNGQYCMIDFRPPMPTKKNAYAKYDMVPNELRNFSQRDTVIALAARNSYFFNAYNPRLGICVPTGCSREDIDEFVSSLSDKIGMTVSAARCEVREENNYTPVVIGVITYYSFLTLLLVAGTLIGTYMYYTKSVFKSMSIRLLLAFSVMPNFKRFSNRKTQSNGLACLSGLRFLSMTSIILSHTYLSYITRMLHGGLKYKAYVGNFFFQVVVNGSLTVDAFFFLSGLLLCHILLTKVRTENFKLSIPMYIIHRLWRILPTYTFIIMSSFLLELFGSGPQWYETTTTYYSQCAHTWWTNLLFINNYYYLENVQMCLIHTWYIAADFQLYLFALVILLPMLRWPKVGVILAFLTISISILYTAIITYVLKHPPTMLSTNIDRQEILRFSSQVYNKPITHAGPYVVGILTGYILVTNPKLRISPMHQVLGWCVAIFFSASTTYGTYRWNNFIDPTVTETVLYAGFSRTVYATGLAWMIICCATGHAGVINYILSLKVFIPLGRLTFLAYLIHPLVMIVVIGSLKTETQADHYIAVWYFFGHLCVSYGLAFIVYMLVELPFNNLEFILLFKPKKEENVTVVNGTNHIKDFNLEIKSNMAKEDHPSEVESSKI